MQSWILSILFLLTLGQTYSQGYTVGEPIDFVISSTTYNSNGTCTYPNPDVYLSFPKSSVTGVENILIITSLVSQTPVLILTGDTLHVNDTLLFTDIFNDYQLISDGNWQISFTAKSIGIPQIPNQPYNCGEGFWFDGLSECDNFLTFQFDDNLCEVADSMIIQSNNPSLLSSDNFYSIQTNTMIENENVDIQMYLNPENNILSIINSKNSTINEIQIIDASGKKENLNFEQDVKIALNLSSFPNGVYIIEINTEKTVFKRKIIKGN